MQALAEIKKSVDEKESTLSKMLTKMSREELAQALRERARIEFQDTIKDKGKLLTDSNFLNSLIKMPGTADTYDYELRRIIEYQIEPPAVLKHSGSSMDQISSVDESARQPLSNN